MVIATSCNQTDGFELLFTLFAWYSSGIHRRQDEGHACGHAQSSVPSFNGKSELRRGCSFLLGNHASRNICKILDLSKSHLTREMHSTINKAIGNPRLIRPINTKRNMVRINAGSIRTMIIHGLTVLITQRFKNYRGNKNATHNNNSNGNKNQVKKAEAKVLDVDLDADMDRTLTIFNLNEEVSNKMVELQDSKPSADNTVHPLPPSTVNNMKITRKQSAKFAISNTNSTSKSMSNKKQRLLNKQNFCKRCKNHHSCYMQTAINRKLHKVDNTSMPDLMTEVTALVKNLTGSLPVKLTRIIIDTGCSKTLIKKQYVPNGLSNAKKAMPNTWSTNGGKFNTHYAVQYPLCSTFDYSTTRILIFHGSAMVLCH
jgi:hypothetical protein